jgi:hypothetical protein
MTRLSRLSCWSGESCLCLARPPWRSTMLRENHVCIASGWVHLHRACPQCPGWHPWIMTVVVAPYPPSLMTIVFEDNYNYTNILYFYIIYNIVALMIICYILFTKNCYHTIILLNIFYYLLHSYSVYHYNIYELPSCAKSIFFLRHCILIKHWSRNTLNEKIKKIKCQLE